MSDVAHPSSPASDVDAFEAIAQAVLFGFPTALVRVTLKQRSRGWRLGGAARSFGGSVVVAPFVALLPPHAIWPIGALVTGAVLARRRWSEHFTIVALEGACPKCSKELRVKKGRLRHPHPLPCDGCHHESSLKFAEGVLPRQ